MQHAIWRIRNVESTETDCMVVNEEQRENMVKECELQALEYNMDCRMKRIENRENMLEE